MLTELKVTCRHRPSWKNNGDQVDYNMLSSSSLLLLLLLALMLVVAIKTPKLMMS